MMKTNSKRPSDPRPVGQALVEFSLAITVFLVLLMGVVDFGMSVYKYNGVSQAAREIARVASVWPGPVSFGVSDQITAVVATQQKLIPGLRNVTFTCTDVSGTAVPLVWGKCNPESPTGEQRFVSVTVQAPYRAATPLGVFGTFTMKGSSSAQLQQ